MPLKRVILLHTLMRVSYALEVFDASDIVLPLWGMVGGGFCRLGVVGCQSTLRKNDRITAEPKSYVEIDVKVIYHV